MSEHTEIPETELNEFKLLKDIEVVFDVGARADVDYLEILPNAEFHLFEPNLEFFQQLKERVGERKNVYLNNYGLGNVEGIFSYENGIQAFEQGEANFKGTDRSLPIKTLDWYIKEHNVKKIDFLKIDTEGYD